MPKRTAPQPPQRMCIACLQPITDGLYVWVQAVRREPYERIRRFACYHPACLPPSLAAVGHRSVASPQPPPTPSEG